ncbi:MAG: hypothetical protein WAK37_17305, partial [Pseudolabrys sp.]
FHHHASPVGQIEYSAVDKPNADFAARRSLYDVTLANRIARFDLNGAVTRSRKSTRTDDDFDFANGKDRRRRWL